MSGRPTKLQLAKIMDFEKCRLAKRLHPRRPAEIQSIKIDTMFLRTSPRIVRWENWLRMWTLVVKFGQNQYFCGKLNNLFLRPARELILSLKFFHWIVLTGTNLSRSGKNLYFEKNDLKMTKSRFFGYGILTTFTKTHFSTVKIEKKYNKVYIAKNYVEDRV